MLRIARSVKMRVMTQSQKPMSDALCRDTSVVSRPNFAVSSRAEKCIRLFEDAAQDARLAPIHLSIRDAPFVRRISYISHIHSQTREVAAEDARLEPIKENHRHVPARHLSGAVQRHRASETVKRQ